jgi:hypothetical protein
LQNEDARLSAGRFRLCARCTIAGMLRHALLSFLAMLAGWLLPSTLFVLGAAVTHSGVESMFAVAFWAGFFVFAAWLLIALPVALFVRPQHVLLRRRVAPLFGFVAGFLSMAWTMFGTSDAGRWLLPTYAGLIGGVAGAVYSALLQREGAATVAAPARV